MEPADPGRPTGDGRAASRCRHGRRRCEPPGNHPLGLYPQVVGVWGVLDVPTNGRSIEILDYRPTTAELRSFLERSDPWDPAGNYIGMNPNYPYARAYLVDGNNIDAAWRELTGDPPPLSYPPEIERVD